MTTLVFFITAAFLTLWIELLARRLRRAPQQNAVGTNLNAAARFMVLRGIRNLASCAMFVSLAVETHSGWGQVWPWSVAGVALILGIAQAWFPRYAASRSVTKS